jgi:hypothetical protein
MIHAVETFKWLYLVYCVFQAVLFGVNLIMILDIIGEDSAAWPYIQISSDIFWQMFLLCFIVRTDTFDELFGQASMLRGLIYTSN